jgi:hypothetical protein
MGQHLNDVKKLVTKGTKSDSFASHFAQHCKKELKPTSDELRKMMKVKIVWQGNAISCMKSFGKIELFIVYARKDRDSEHNSSGGMKNYKPLQ